MCNGHVEVENIKKWAVQIEVNEDLDRLCAAVQDSSRACAALPYARVHSLGLDSDSALLYKYRYSTVRLSAFLLRLMGALYRFWVPAEDRSRSCNWRIVLQSVGKWMVIRPLLLPFFSSLSWYHLRVYLGEWVVLYLD
jgi:hypothetical protein